MATISDVAKRAGVSVALVSRYLNHVPGVGVKSREKIQRAIEECGYQRNELARSLVQLRTRAIGVLVDSLESAFFKPLIDGLIDAAQRMGYTVLFGLPRGTMALKDQVTEYFTHKMVDGVIVYGSAVMDRKIIERLAKLQFPFVLIENDEPGINADKVLIDNFQAQYAMTRYLLEGGLRDVRYIPWGYQYRAGIERRDGFCQAMSEFGLMDSRRLCFEPVGEAEVTYEEVEAMLRGMLAAGDLPEAFVCGADIRAADLLVACRRLGVRVPEQLSVTGFDGDELMLSYYGYPQVATMVQPLRQMAERAVEMLVGRFQDSQRPCESARFSASFRLGETIRLKR